jgi:hypothetical protein
MKEEAGRERESGSEAFQAPRHLKVASVFAKSSTLCSRDSN